MYSAELSRSVLVHVKISGGVSAGRDPLPEVREIIQAIQAIDRNGGVLVTGDHVTITIQPLDGKTHA